MGTAAEARAMRRAVAASRLGLGRTSPNPVVGAVVLDQAGHVVGTGFHAAAGTAHAEVVALAAAGPAAAGGTLVVTLEPCDHTGRTPPCTEAVLAAGVRRVVYAVADPVHPGGGDRLRAAGVSVQGGVLAEAAGAANEAWLLAARLHRPFVTWKYAATLDGRVAAADGSSRWVTGPAARADSHRLRDRHDAVCVGVGTVLADDPALTTRDAAGRPVRRQPLRVVLDSVGRTPAGARVRDGAAPTLVLTAAATGGDGAGRVDVAAALRLLFDRDVRSVLLEGGPTVAGAFVRAGCVDKVVGYLAPKLLGDGPPALAGAGVAGVAAAHRLHVADLRRVGPDVRVTAYPERG